MKKLLTISAMGLMVSAMAAGSGFAEEMAAPEDAVQAQTQMQTENRIETHAAEAAEMSVQQTQAEAKVEADAATEHPAASSTETDVQTGFQLSPSVDKGATNIDSEPASPKAEVMETETVKEEKGSFISRLFRRKDNNEKSAAPQQDPAEQ